MEKAQSSWVLAPKKVFREEWYISGSLLISPIQDLQDHRKVSMEFCAPDFDVVAQKQLTQVERFKV